MTGVKSLILVNYDATDKEIYLFRTIQFLHMHNIAPHYIATATRIILYIVCFYYLFIVPPISSRILVANSENNKTRNISLNSTQ